MAKKGNSGDNRKKIIGVKKSTRVKSTTPGFFSRLHNQWGANSPKNSNEAILKKVFWGSFLFMVIFSVLAALQTGINEDEKFHHGYEKVLMDFYSSFGADKSALFVETGKMHFYGGLFDIITGMTNRALGNTSPEQPGFHHVRHFYNALFGCIAILFTALLARLAGGWQAALLALYFIFLSPRFLGHSMMNPRDIPFAAGYIMSIFYISKMLTQMPKPSWKTVTGLAVGIMLSIGARAGGFLLIAYLGLFSLVDYFIRFGLSNAPEKSKVFINYVKYPAIASICGVGAALLFWPYGLVDPFTNVLKALMEFSNYSTNIRMLFGGELLWAQSLPLPTYIFTWLGQSIPLFSLLGLVFFIFLFKRIVSKVPVLPVALTLFTFLFPISYILYKGSTLYDGMRHLLFVYTPMVVLAALAWSKLIDLFSEKVKMKYITLGLLTILLLEPAIFIARNLSYFYVYFNPLSGGVNGTFGKYEQDYWGISVKKAIDWMEEEGIISSTMTDTVMIASNFSSVAGVYCTKFEKKVQTRYSRFRERFDKEWDYAIYVGRFIDPGQLNSGYWPSSKAIHTIKANGVPIAAIYKNADTNAYNGYQAGKKRDWIGAIRFLEPEVQNYPDNDLAWMFLGNAYMNTGQAEKGADALQQALRINPDNSQSLSTLGNYFVSKGMIKEAQDIYLKMVKINESDYTAYYYLSAIALQQNNLNIALDNANMAIQYNPRFKQAYDLMATIYDKMGDSQTAAQFRAAAQQM